MTTPFGLLGDALAAIAQYPAVAALFVLVYLILELHHPKGRFRRLEDKIEKQHDRRVLVLRALARANDGVDEDEVDDFLLNGGTVDDFLINGVDRSRFSADDETSARGD